MPAGSIPKVVERYVDEGKKDGMSEDKAWAIAWSRFCKGDPSSDHCKQDSYFDGKGKKKAAEASQIAGRFLSAATTRLDPKIKTSANRALIKAGLDGNGRFRTSSEALAKANEVLSGVGVEWGEVINSFQLKPENGRVTIRLALSNPEDPFSPTDISNSVLAFHWTTLDADKIEAVAYLS